MRFFSLVKVFLRLSTLNELQYRANFFMELFNSVLALVTGLAGLALVFYHTTTLGGWTPPELLIVMGVYTFIGGLVAVFVQPNMYNLMEGIQQGNFDYTLTKPEDAQVLASIAQFQVWKAVDLLLGVGVIVAGVVQLGSTIGAGEAVIFAVTLLAGGVIVYSLWLILTTTSFWFVNVWSILGLLESIYQAGRWPVGVYPGWLRIGLTFLVPVALAVTVPAEALTGRITLSTMVLILAIALVMGIGSRVFWRFGLKHYSGASA